MPHNTLSMTFGLATLVGLSIGALPVAAQAPQRSEQLPPVATKPAAPQSPKASPGAKQPAGNNDAAALQQRVDQLEEQLIDLQVVIGTLESLAKSPSSQAAPAAAADAQRIQALESQLKSLSGQIEQLGEKVRGAGEPTKRSEAPSAPSPSRQQAQDAQTVEPAGDQPTTQSQGSATVTSSRPNELAPGSALPPIGSEPAASPPPSQQAAGQDTAALPPSSDPGDAKHDYEVAYSYIIQRDYGAAQAGFTDFMKRHPKDALVPNALYWLGETHYQQRNFADAAEAFDLVTKLYASSPKAADSQLKRALSYSALGKNNEACAALSDLNSKFQNAPVYVKTRAGSERHRLGCTG